MPEPGDLLTTAAAAKELGISRRTLTRYAANGTLRPTLTLPSGQYRWTLADIRRQLSEKGESPDA